MRLVKLEYFHSAVLEFNCCCCLFRQQKKLITFLSNLDDEPHSVSRSDDCSRNVSTPATQYTPQQGEHNGSFSTGTKKNHISDEASSRESRAKSFTLAPPCQEPLQDCIDIHTGNTLQMEEERTHIGTERVKCEATDELWGEIAVKERKCEVRGSSEQQTTDHHSNQAQHSKPKPKSQFHSTSHSIEGSWTQLTPQRHMCDGHANEAARSELFVSLSASSLPPLSLRRPQLQTAVLGKGRLPLVGTTSDSSFTFSAGPSPPTPNEHSGDHGMVSQDYVCTHAIIQCHMNY